ncbi:MAG: hypothetical protein KKH83_04605 [Candidatus Margulisbacteria bacterium]|nr:hypothetical protein [Candidatus Margulisiibacteriota bacterium]
MSFDITKKIYYYVICLITFFVIMWGAIDAVSSSFSLYMVKSQQSIVPDKGEIPFDLYYQNKMSQDRLFDSVSRVVIASLFFAYAKWRLNKLEGKA